MLVKDIKLVNQKQITICFKPLLNIRIDIFFTKNTLNGILSTEFSVSEEVEDLGIPIFNKLTILENPKINLFYKQIPIDIINLVDDFEYLNYYLVAFSLRKKKNFIFFLNNPLLTWLICDSILHGKLVNRSIDDIILLKRQEILKLAKFPYDKQHIKFINKIRLITGNKYELKLIKEILIKFSDSLDIFRHWNEVPISSIYLFVKYSFLQNSYLLKFLTKNDKKNVHEYGIGINKIQEVFQDTINLGVNLQIKDPEAIVNKCSSISSLRELHSKWIILLNRVNNYFSPDIILPKHPFSGNKTIIPIGTANELIREGKKMNHCLATYIEMWWYSHFGHLIRGDIITP